MHHWDVLKRSLWDPYFSIATGDLFISDPQRFMYTRIIIKHELAEDIWKLWAMMIAFELKLVMFTATIFTLLELNYKVTACQLWKTILCNSYNTQLSLHVSALIYKFLRVFEMCQSNKLKLRNFEKILRIFLAGNWFDLFLTVSRLRSILNGKFAFIQNYRRIIQWYSSVNRQTLERLWAI